jgi:DNA-binding CsgD family transcriptional regulator
MLDAVGLTTTEEQAYRAVVRARSIAPDDLRTQLRLTLDQADVVFGSLAAKGLITSTTGPGKRLVAAPVDVAAEALLLRRLGELQAARLEFSRIAEEYHRTAGNSVDEMIEIAPADAVPTLFEQLQRQAKTEVWTITTPPYAVPSGENAVELEQLASGLSYLALYTQAALDEPGALEEIRHYVEAGEQARMQPSLSLKMAVFDREIALVPIVAAGPGAGRLGDSLIVHPCSLLDALIELFERLWMSAVPVGPLLSGPTVVAGAASGGRGITAQEARLLAMLLAGMTDDTVGRHLGLARRTVARRVHQLMLRAKATNRLQLILRAAQLGWVEVSDAAPALRPRRSPEMRPLAPRAVPGRDVPVQRHATPAVPRDEPPLAVVDA